MDKAIIGDCRVGHTRVGVVRDDWDRLLKAFEGIASCDVTRRKLWLGSIDSTTGWYEKKYTESTVEALFVTSGARQVALQMGTYVRLDALLRTADPVAVGDEIRHPSGDYYEVKTVKPNYIGESFFFRECDLMLLPLHE